MEERYLKFSNWLKDKFGERVLKICVDGGFTCPNRDGKCGVGGCIFCSEKGSGEHIKNLNITEQVLSHLNSYRGKRANKFIVYFQNFSNTYDSVKNLKIKYDQALVSDKIVALSVATRPDCINEEIVKLLSSYAKKYYVYVELGLQTVNEEVARFCNRGYSNQQFTQSVELLNKYNIPVVVHIMVGLPNEKQDDIAKIVNFINNHNIQGVKIHSTYVVKNTKLHNLYLAGEYEPLKFEDYIKNVIYIITHLKKDIVIHRISGDAPKDILVVPEWNMRKKRILNCVFKTLNDKNLYQGCFYKN